jgi:hypothetical protein
LQLPLPTGVQISWAVSAIAQLSVCAVVLARGHFRRLPFFTTYLVLNILQAVLLFFAYRTLGDSSNAAKSIAWWSEAITLAARICATVEIIWLVIQAYRGIWGLAWRLLAACCSAALLIAVLASAGDRYWALVEVDRSFHLVFAAGLISVLVLLHHYSVPVHPVYKALMAGFCFYSCLKVLMNTVRLLYGEFERYEQVWQTGLVLAFSAMMFWWAGALRRALPAKIAQPAAPDGDYACMRSQIQLQLEAINGQLVNFWKIEGPHR